MSPQNIIRFFPAFFAILTAFQFPAYAVVYLDFAVFAENDVDAGNNSQIYGKVGANNDVDYGSGVYSEDVFAGNDFKPGNNSIIDGNSVANGEIDAGSGVQFKGNVDAGQSFNTGNNSIIDGNVTAGGAVSFGSGVHAKSNISTGGNFTLGNNSSVDGNSKVEGNISTGTNVTLQGDVNVQGGVPALGGGSQILGTTTVGPVTPDTPESFSPLSVPSATVFASGGSNVSKGSGQSTTLAPGSYDSITLGNNNILNLSSGQYFFSSFSSGTGLDLNLDLTGGDISIFVTNAFGIGNNGVLVLTNGTASGFYLETGSDFTAGTGVDWSGTVFTPNGNLYFGNNSSIIGALYSGNNITLGTGVIINYASSNYLNPGSNPTVVPEPGTFLLTGLGIILFSLRRKLFFNN